MSQSLALVERRALYPVAVPTKRPFSRHKSMCSEPIDSLLTDFKYIAKYIALRVEIW